MLFKLALLNLSRNRKRTLVTLLGITLSLGILVFVEGFFQGISVQSEKNLIDYQTAHLMIAQPGFDDEKDSKPLDYLWSDFGRTRKTIGDLPQVEGVTPRLRFPARLNDGEDELPCMGIGIDLAGTDEKVFRLKKAIIEGRYLNRGEAGILIGNSLAELFAISPGESITVVVRTRYEALEAMDLEIAGIVRTGNPWIDQNVFYLPLSLARSITEAPNEITELMVRLKPAAEAQLPVV